jgi:hypothetical protein
MVSIIGWAGAGCLLTVYALLQPAVISANDRTYLVVSVIGSAASRWPTPAAAAVRSLGGGRVLAHRDDAVIVRGEHSSPAPDLTPAEQTRLDPDQRRHAQAPPCPDDAELKP